jgi:hypothetical protein
MFYIVQKSIYICASRYEEREMFYIVQKSRQGARQERREKPSTRTRQRVLPGQAVPPGLWIKMDISSGATYAKFIGA